MLYLLMIGLLTSCATNSYQACYDREIAKIKANRKDGFVFTYQKRRAAAICKMEQEDV